MAHNVTLEPTTKISNNFFLTKVCPTCHGEGEVQTPDTYNNPANKDKVEKYKNTCPQYKGAKRISKEFISS